MVCVSPEPGAALQSSHQPRCHLYHQDHGVQSAFPPGCTEDADGAGGPQVWSFPGILEASYCKHLGFSTEGLLCQALPARNVPEHRGVDTSRSSQWPS